MQRSSVRGVLVGAVVLGTGAGATAPAAAAEVREADDYVAVVIEAEDYVTIDERWVPTDATTAPTPETDPDPDGNHSDGASGGMYLEVLPDHRQKHELTVPEGTPLSKSLWGKPGTGPSASYAVDFPEPGRYHVHVRAYTTGTEDNGIHIGLNGNWPSSGAALQICTAAAREWRWSDKKRDSGGQSCGIRHTIWLDVDEAGPATVWISAREDGFEIDRMILIKDRSDNTRRCAPVFNQPDNIACEDGGIDAADEFVDLDVSLESSVEEGVVGDRVRVVASLGNRDRFDAASGVELAFAVDADDWRLVTADEGCEREGGNIVCAVGELRPAPAEEDTEIVLTLEALRGGLLPVEASATALEDDDTPGNDSGRLQFEIDDPVRPTTLSVTLGGVPAVIEPGASTALLFSVANTGATAALDTELLLTVSNELEVRSVPVGCTSSAGGSVTEIECPVGVLGAGENRAFPLTVTPGSEGDYAVGVRANAANAPSGDAMASLDVSEPDEPDETDEMDKTAGGDMGGAGGNGEGGDGAGSGTADGGDDGDEDVAGGDDVEGAEAGDGVDGESERQVVAQSDGGAVGPLLALGLALVGVARRRSARRA